MVSGVDGGVVREGRREGGRARERMQARNKTKRCCEKRRRQKKKKVVGKEGQKEYQNERMQNNRR